MSRKKRSKAPKLQSVVLTMDTLETMLEDYESTRGYGFSVSTLADASELQKSNLEAMFRFILKEEDNSTEERLLELLEIYYKAGVISESEYEAYQDSEDLQQDLIQLSTFDNIKKVVVVEGESEPKSGEQNLYLWYFIQRAVISSEIKEVYEEIEDPEMSVEERDEHIDEAQTVLGEVCEFEQKQMFLKDGLAFSEADEEAMEALDSFCSKVKLEEPKILGDWDEGDASLDANPSQA